MRAHYRRIAGNLELVCGAYFIAAGALAAVYFQRLHRPHFAMIAVAGALAGILFVARASRLLGWRAWLFWTIASVITIVPIAWLAPPLLAH